MSVPRLIVCGVLGLSAFFAPLRASTTLDQAVARAWEKNYGLKNQVLNEEAARAERDFASWQRLFRLDFAGTFRYASDAVQVTAANFPFTSLFHIPPGQVLLSAPKDTYDLKLSLVQPLWTGGSLTKSLKADEARRTAAADRTRVVKAELAGRVKTSYYTFRLLEAKRRSLETMLESLRLHRSRVEAFYQNDLARKSDLLETEAKEAETELSIEDLNQQAAKERIAFETLCGLPPEEIDPAASESVGDFASSWAEFQAVSPFLKSLDALASSLELSGQAVAGTRLPQVAAFGEAHYARPGLNFFEKQWKAYGIAGLTLTVPVFNLSRTNRDRALIEVQRRQLANQRAEALEQAEMALKQLYETRRSLEARAGVVDRLIGLAGEDAGLKEKLYRESQLSNLDYLASLTDLERYRSLKDELRLQLELVKVAVNVTIGRTGEKP